MPQDNLADPISAGTGLPQVDTENASAATKRFLINSTVGLAGMQDKTTEMGYRSPSERSGTDTRQSWRGNGNAHCLPLLGPSNRRDAIQLPHHGQSAAACG